MKSEGKGKDGLSDGGNPREGVAGMGEGGIVDAGVVAETRGIAKM